MTDRLGTVSLVIAAVVFFGLAAAASAAPPLQVGPRLSPGLNQGVVLVWDDRITQTLDLPTLHLQQARGRMLAGQSISFEDMRALADHGDGLAAFRYANRLMDLDRPDLLSAAAHYYAAAALTNRDYAVGPLIRLLRREDVAFSQARLRHLENVLRTLADSGNEPAATALMAFYSSGHPFGPHRADAAAMQSNRATSGDAEAALDLVMQLMSGQGVAGAGPHDIEAWFATLETSGDPGHRATALNMRRLYDADPARYIATTPTALQEDLP